MATRPGSSVAGTRVPSSPPAMRAAVRATVRSGVTTRPATQRASSAPPTAVPRAHTQHRAQRGQGRPQVVRPGDFVGLRVHGRQRHPDGDHRPVGGAPPPARRGPAGHRRAHLRGHGLDPVGQGGGEHLPAARHQHVGVTRRRRVGDDPADLRAGGQQPVADGGGVKARPVNACSRWESRSSRTTRWALVAKAATRPAEPSATLAGAEHHHRRVADRPYPADEGEAVQAAEHEVDQQHVQVGAPGEHGHALLGAGGAQDLVALVLQDHRQGGADAVVVDDQQVRHRAMVSAPARRGIGPAGAPAVAGASRT